MSDKNLDRYSEILISLIKESISCSPQSWNSGTLTIECDGPQINYKLKNPNEEDKAQISGELRQLCEDIYVAMGEDGHIWSKAEISFFREGGDWNYNVKFDYQTSNHNDTGATNFQTGKPCWKIW